MPKPILDTNSVVEEYKGFKIRKYNKISLRVDELTYKDLIDAKEETGLSDRKILGYSSMPCRCCEGTHVIIFTDNGERKIKRGIFAKRIPELPGHTNKKAHVESNRVSKAIIK